MFQSRSSVCWATGHNCQHTARSHYACRRRPSAFRCPSTPARAQSVGVLLGPQHAQSLHGNSVAPCAQPAARKHSCRSSLVFGQSAQFQEREGDAMRQQVLTGLGFCHTAGEWAAFVRWAADTKKQPMPGPVINFTPELRRSSS